VYLIVNLGLKSIRIIIFDDEAKVIYSDSLPVHTSLKSERVEQDVNEWRDLFFKLLNGLATKTDLIGKINFITSTTSSSCVFGYDKEMKPITNALMVSDKRAIREVSAIKSNSMFIERNSETPIYCNESSNVPKLLWFKNNEFNVFKKIKYWLGANEFLHYEFTDEIFTDSLNASKSFYSDKANKYHEDILSDLSISSNVFAEVQPIGSSYNLGKKLIDKYHFNKDCRYILTTYDAICAVIGSLTGGSGDVCDVSGTVTSVRTLVPSNIEIKNKASVVLQQEIALIQKTMIGCSNNLGGGIIEWYKQAFFQNTNKQSYSKMESEALFSPPGANGLIFLPFLLGERAPFIDNNIKATFFGINRDSKREDFTRAVFESTAFVTNDLISLIRNEGFLVKSLSVSGGLARFDTINQIKSDVTNLPVKVINNFESTSLGALILLRISLGHFSSVNVAATKLVSIRKTIHPNKVNVEIYAEIFDLYREMTKLSMNVSNAHSKLMNKMEKYTTSTLRNL
jgi:sugar (pentulose or hexulose) kinase